MDKKKNINNQKKSPMWLNRFIAKESNQWICMGIIIEIIFVPINYVLNLVDHVEYVLPGSSQSNLWWHLAFLFWPRIITYFPVYLIGAMAGVLIFMLNWHKIKMNYADLNMDQKGSSRWTTLEELKSQYRSIPEKNESYPGKGGFLVSRYDDKLLIDDTPVNNLIIGTTRSGKGETVIFPMIDLYSRAKDKSSLCIMDPKLDLYAASKAVLEQRGYKILILNLTECSKGIQYNPLQIIIDAYKKGNYSEAELLCNTFAASLFPTDKKSGQEQFWNLNAINVLCALILALVEDCISEGHEEKINMYSLMNLFQEMIQIPDADGRYVLDLYFQSRPERDRAKMKYATVASAPPKTKGGIFATMTQNLTLFTYEEIAKMTCGNSIDLKDMGFGDQPIALFLGVPDYDTSRHFLASTFISQLYYVLAKSASLAPAGKCAREVVFLLDEFGNMPRISNFDHIITVCLGRNIKFNLIIQAIEQLQEKYGDQEAKIIMANCGNIMYLLTSAYYTAQTISQMLGNATITNIDRSGTELSYEKSFREDYIAKPLLDPNQLMNELPEGCNVVCRSLKRTDLNGQDIHAYPIYNHDETRFKYRYQYLLDTFPAGQSIDMIIPQPLYEVDLAACVYYPLIYISIQRGMCPQWLAVKNKLLEYWPKEKFDGLTLEQIKREVAADETINEADKKSIIKYLTPSALNLKMNQGGL